METILRDLRQPEYLHVLLNPIPVYGLAIALFGLIAATYLHSRGGQLTALVLIFACAISVWAVVRQGDLAYNPVLSMADEDGATASLAMDTAVPRKQTHVVQEVVAGNGLVGRVLKLRRSLELIGEDGTRMVAVPMTIVDDVRATEPSSFAEGKRRLVVQRHGGQGVTVGASPVGQQATGDGKTQGFCELPVKTAEGGRGEFARSVHGRPFDRRLAWSRPSKESMDGTSREMTLGYEARHRVGRDQIGEILFRVGRDQDQIRR